MRVYPPPKDPEIHSRIHRHRAEHSVASARKIQNSTKPKLNKNTIKINQKQKEKEKAKKAITDKTHKAHKTQDTYI